MKRTKEGPDWVCFTSSKQCESCTGDQLRSSASHVSATCRYLVRRSNSSLFLVVASALPTRKLCDFASQSFINQRILSGLKIHFEKREAQKFVPSFFFFQGGKYHSLVGKHYILGR